MYCNREQKKSGFYQSHEQKLYEAHPSTLKNSNGIRIGLLIQFSKNNAEIYSDKITEAQIFKKI